MGGPSTNPAIDFDRLETLLKTASSDDALSQVIVNAPFENFAPEMAKLFLGVIVLLMVNKSTGTIDRIAITANDIAERTKRKSKKRFKDIKVPVGYTKNIIVKAVKTGKPQSTDDWEYLHGPALTAEEARLNQADGGIAFSVVYPLKGARDGGALIFSYYQYPDKIGPAQKDFMRKYSELVAKRLTA